MRSVIVDGNKTFLRAKITYTLDDFCLFPAKYESWLNGFSIIAYNVLNVAYNILL